ncbi:MAG: hypothetical protein KKG42_02325 [Gammaproteobacteria bacterium]|uniref:Uncharacterized protein n=1 Tax=viral metagenome TaxID=1070528 RepID=A0A6M3M675_9ZZZZ|nr:hypothetical protein [Gammaproteobacteria bacterium]
MAFRFGRTRTGLIRATATRLAAEALADIDLNERDFNKEDRLTAEERVAIYAEIRSIANQLLLEAEQIEARLQPSSV